MAFMQIPLSFTHSEKSSIIHFPCSKKKCITIFSLAFSFHPTLHKFLFFSGMVLYIFVFLALIFISPIFRMLLQAAIKNTKLFLKIVSLEISLLIGFSS